MVVGAVRNALAMGFDGSLGLMLAREIPGWIRTLELDDEGAPLPRALPGWTPLYLGVSHLPQ